MSTLHGRSSRPVVGGPPYGPSRILFAASKSKTPLEFLPTQSLTLPAGSQDPAENNHGAMPAVAPNGDVYVVWSAFTLGAEPNTAPQKTIKLSDRQMAVPIFTTQTRPMPTPARPSRALRRRSAGCATRTLARPEFAASALEFSAPAGSRTSPSTTRRLVIGRAETSMSYFRRSRLPRRPRELNILHSLH